MAYRIIRTATADEGIRKIVLYIAQVFGNETALHALDEIEERIMLLAKDPYMGTVPRYSVLRKQGYRVLVLKKGLVFYKVHEESQEVVIYAVTDQRQDYLAILRGL